MKPQNNDKKRAAQASKNDAARLKKAKKEVKTKMTIPRSAQESIPYVAIYKNGIIETTPGRFTKCYLLGDANFSIASQEEQNNLFTRYEEFLNMFAPETEFQISIINRKVDEKQVADEILIKHRSDGLDEYRDEMNEILKSKLAEGKNNLKKEKYLTVCCKAEDVEEASNVFTRLDAEISATLKKINDYDVVPMTIEERLNLLYDIYNMDSPISFNAKATFEGYESEFFNIDMLSKYGITSKDFIAPASMRFKKDYIEIGDKFARVLFVETYPSFLSTDFLASVSDTQFNMMTSISYESLHQDKTMKMLKNQRTSIDANIVDAQKRAARNGYSGNIISPSLLKAQEETNKLIEDITSRNQKLFYTTVTFTVFADSLDELNKNTNAITSAASKYLISIKKLNYQQEPGLTTTLPLAHNKLAVQRFLTTETAALYIPFTAKELTQKHGFYYGLNAVSHNLILYNRLTSKNANGIILGTPGSGKSFSAKREILSVILNTDDDVFIIDPEREYAPMAKMLNGETIRIAAGSPTHINPFDMDIDYANGDDPIALKSDFIETLCETIIGGRYGLSAMQKSVIGRCVKLLYEPYIRHIQTQKALGREISLDTEKTPTMVDFFNILMKQPEPEAKNLALAIELYSTGSLDTFAHKTNVNTNNRLVVYDIKDIGSSMKELGLQVCLNDVWNKTIANHARGKRTWFYIDEFYLLTQTDSSAQFLQQIFKRARKWGGCPTGITQNVEDMLASKEARTIISNCEFIMMLNQAPIDAADLADMFNISPTQMSYITNASEGQGLLYMGRDIIPFIDKYPTNTKTFSVMTTKFDDVKRRNS